MQRSWQLIILIITAIVLWRFIVFIVNKYTKESMTQNSLYSIPMMTVNTAQHGNHKIPVHHIKYIKYIIKLFLFIEQTLIHSYLKQRLIHYIFLQI